MPTFIGFIVIPSVARDLGGWGAKLMPPASPAQVPRYARDDTPLHLASRVRADQIVDPRRLLGHERLAVSRADQRAEVPATRVDHVQELRIGDERLRLFRI